MATRKLFFLCLLLCSLFSCNKKKVVVKYTDTDAAYIHRCQKKLTDITVIDIFSPPVASRLYVYPMLAAFEAGKFANNTSTTLTGKLKDFDEMPVPEMGKEYDFTLAAIKAFCNTSKKVVFSTKEIDVLEKQLLIELKERNSNDVYERSIAFGNMVSEKIIKRLSNDNYKETRGMPRFEVTNQPGRWVPTLPDYADAVEPHWSKMKPMIMDSASQFNMAIPFPFNENSTSDFYEQAKEVCNAVKNITPGQDEIVRFWDDNPFVSRTKGHLMFQEKKMTPGGHWLAICRTICLNKKNNFYKSINAYALTSLSLYEAFIGCWDLKYTSALVRPETVIIDKIDKNWNPYLITPNFPSFTSGHSTVSAAAAEVLTALYGDNFVFTDSTEKEYNLPVRSFPSFRAAALEASASRLFAGIHYKMDCDKGNEQGKNIGNFIIQKLKIKN